MEKASITVENLKCHGCSNTIINSLSKIEGVEKVVVIVENALVEFEYNEKKVDLETVKKKLSTLGYPEKGNNSLGANIKSYYSCMVGRIS